MPIRQPPAKIECDFCPASYEAEKPVLRPDWRHVTVDGEQKVACGRHLVENLVIDPASALDAADLYYDEALRGARRAGVDVRTDN